MTQTSYILFKKTYKLENVEFLKSHMLLLGLIYYWTLTLSHFHNCSEI